ncbi:hypothetical protein H7J86_03495 [Mycobacterium hackensackense]|uniref:hypothetical protein n=1 Tax=Mycobacterium hackensackense TaxID=228909 RepID=UPI002265C5A5|nr:hypothetical protein [Mycobacterium hackensackense]MCV7251216.1 hypothetical protein [Mycobacterium hackensackense]
MTTPIHNQVVDLEDQINAAEARAQQMREHAKAIDTAGYEARNAADYEHVQYLHTAADECNQARTKAEARFTDLSTAERLDHAKLFAAFIALKDADARCEAVSVDYMTRIGRHEEPTVSVHTGVAMGHRGVGTSAKFKRTTWTETLEGVISARHARIATEHRGELIKRADDKAEAASDQARAEASATAQAALAASE